LFGSQSRRRKVGREYYADAPPMVVSKDDVRHLIQGAILEIARRGEAVIVAHAASYALARRPDTLRVFVTASPDVGRLRGQRDHLVVHVTEAQPLRDGVADRLAPRRRHPCDAYDSMRHPPYLPQRGIAGGCVADVNRAPTAHFVTTT
jgi:hypothetical protein